VTSVGVDTTTAARWIRGMHGEHRIPTLLARADRLCRDAAR
jgi:deoxyribonuclease V